ncbi:hypothetical protein BD414DRAFT_257035 [Trametes punicea]|nr:hypothetical protein BD414DRAFT_257035 [Trametes punicea]
MHNPVAGACLWNARLRRKLREVRWILRTKDVTEALKTVSGDRQRGLSVRPRSVVRVCSHSNRSMYRPDDAQGIRLRAVPHTNPSLHGQAIPQGVAEAGMVATGGWRHGLRSHTVVPFEGSCRTDRACRTSNDGNVGKEGRHRDRSRGCSAEGMQGGENKGQELCHLRSCDWSSGLQNGKLSGQRSHQRHWEFGVVETSITLKLESGAVESESGSQGIRTACWRSQAIAYSTLTSPYDAQGSTQLAVLCDLSAFRSPVIAGFSAGSPAKECSRLDPSNAALWIMAASLCLTRR